MRSYFTEIGQKILDMADGPETLAEIFLSREQELTISFFGEQMENFQQAEELGLGLRLLQKGRIGFAYSNDFSPLGLEHLVQAAREALQYAKPNPYAMFPASCDSYPSLPLYDTSLPETDQNQKIKLVLEAEKAALSLSADMEKIESAGYAENNIERMIMNSRALQTYEKSNGCGIYLLAHAKKGERRGTGSYSYYGKRLQQLQPIALGEEAGIRALQALRADIMPSGNYPCIFEPRIAARFLGLLSSAFSQEQVQKGKSMLRNKLQQEIAAPLLTLYDDGLDTRGAMFTSFDGEGSPVQKNKLIEQGILKGYICDTTWGKQVGGNSSGNSYRNAYSALPGISVNQLVLEPGAESQEQIGRAHV